MLFTSRKETQVTDQEAMRQVMLLLDEWEAPEPTPWFDARMMARFREEQTREPEGFLARLRDRWQLGSTVAMKPLMAGAMALLLLAGGGGYWQSSHHAKLSQPGVSATVEDLQVLDNNEQTIQQMGQLLDDSDDSSQS